MCGLGGIIGRYHKNDIGFFNDLNYRGPDGESSIFLDGYLGFFRRLSIVDEKNGMQPFFSPNKKKLIFINGEIYNFRNLSECINSKNLIKTQNDIEPLIHLYEKYGISFLKKLNGIFAGCLVDQEKKITYLFRDRWGIKKLYYGIGKNNISYCSLIKPIRKILKGQSQYSKKGLSSYLLFRHIKAPLTFFSNIYELLPGEVIKINMESLEVKKTNFFSLSKEIVSSKAKYKNFTKKDWEYNLEESLNNSIKLQTKSNLKKGVYLSGGVDSSLLLSLMKKTMIMGKMVH